jgi:hypothetical protein
MAIIIDPDFLLDSAIDDVSTNVFINISSRTIKLNNNVGALSDDGVTIKAFYSFLKEQWRNDPNTKNLAAFPFPMVPITDESFELVDGWDLANDTTRYLLRTGGWTVRNAAGSITQKWAGIIGLGSIEFDDQLYYDQLSGSTNVQLLGQINQAVQILSDSNGDGVFDFDNRNYYKLFVREYAQVYDDASLADIGVTQMDSIAYRFPIGTSTDLKITNLDEVVSSSAPYNEIHVRYFTGSFLREVDLDLAYRAFGVVIDVGTHSGVDGSVTSGGSTLTSVAGGISGSNFVGGTLVIHSGSAKGEYTLDGNVPQDGSSIDITTTFPATMVSASFTLYKSSSLGATAEQIYEKVQFLLRQNTNINAIPTGSVSVIGKTSDLLLNFVGDTLQAGTFNPINPATGSANGVIIEGFSPSDTNRLVFRDATEANRTYPFVAVLTLQFGTNLVTDANARYWVYFAALPGVDDDYGQASAILVQDNALNPMSGAVAAQSAIQRTFNYDGNTQGGRTAGTDADIVAVSIGLSTGQYVRALGTIAKSISNTVSLVAPLERNYDNPV